MTTIHFAGKEYRLSPATPSYQPVDPSEIVINEYETINGATEDTNNIISFKRLYGYEYAQP